MINTILLLGSSTISKWKKFTLKLENENVINKGVSSLLTNDLFTHEYMQNIKNVEPNYIIFYCGINDVLKNIDNKTIIANVELFLEKLHCTFCNSKIIVLSLIKSPKIYKKNKIENVDYINNKLWKFCTIKSTIYTYLNVNKELHNSKYYDDELHVNEMGYEKITKKIIENIYIV